MATANWEINFDRMYLVEEITIKFKFLPAKVSISVLSTDGKWITKLTESPHGDILVMMAPT